MKRVIFTILLAFLFQSLWGLKSQDKVYKVGVFSKVAIAGGFNINISQSHQAALSINGKDDILQRIRVSVKDGLLLIEMTKQFDRRWRIKQDDVPTINLSIVKLAELQINGYATLRSNNQLKVDNIDVNLTGSNKIDLDLSCNRLTLESSGASYIRLKGSGKSFDLTMSGAGIFDGFDYTTSSSNIAINGTGKARVHSQDIIKGHIYGLGALYYKGTPKLEVKRSIGIIHHVP